MLQMYSYVYFTEHSYILILSYVNVHSYSIFFLNLMRTKAAFILSENIVKQ